MELKEKGLLENGEQMPNKFEGLSRREIVRKVGFASLVALPVISSIIAPKAAAATTPPCVQEGGNLRFRIPDVPDAGVCSTENRDCDCENPTRIFNGAIVPATTVAPCCRGLLPSPEFCARREISVTCFCFCRRV